MAMQTHEFKAKSVDEAIEEGLTTLGLTREAVDIEVINKGSRGIFGIGSEPAVIRLTVRATPPAVEQPPLASATPPNSPVAQPAITTEVQAPSATTANSTAAVETIVQENTLASSVSATDALEAGVADESTDEQFSDEEFEDEADQDDLSYAPRVPLVTTASEDELATMAADMLSEIIHLMGFKADVTASWQDDDQEDDEEEVEGVAEDAPESVEAGEERRNRYLHLDIEGTDLGPLIGRRGETLDNLQYLLRLMINQKIHKWKNIIIDVEHYKERRLNQLRQLAARMADQVARTGRAISLEPMPANERRIVHMVLRDHPDVYTESYGEGPRRKVHIFARD